jgi:hypothetical protein
MTDEEALARITAAQGSNRSAEPASQDTAQERVDQLWTRITDYGEMITNGIPDPTFLPTPTLAKDFIYENALSLICGHRKHGKSHIATLIALDAVNAGRRVIIMDYENGGPRIGRRLKDLGANPKRLSKLMRGYSFPEMDCPEAMELFLEDIAMIYPGAVVLVDAFRGYASKVGGRDFNPNDNNSIERVMAPMVKVTKSMALSIIVIDHPNRMTTGDSIYKASNSAAKEQAVDAIYWVHKENEYNVMQQGAISIRADNDRDGRLPIEPLYFKVGGQGPDAPFFIEQANAIDVGNSARIAQEIIALLNETNEPMLLSKIRDQVKGNNKTIADVLQECYIRELINFDGKLYSGGPFQGSSI